MPHVVAPSRTVRLEALERLAALAAPPGAFGRLGDLAVWVAACQGRVPPAPVDHVRLVIFAGDHGVAAHGVVAELTDLVEREGERRLGGEHVCDGEQVVVGGGVEPRAEQVDVCVRERRVGRDEGGVVAGRPLTDDVVELHDRHRDDRVSTAVRHGR